MRSATVVKRSLVLNGHKTSVSLEDAFWRGLRDIAQRRRLTIRQMIELIDAGRTQSNLSSAIRLYVLAEYQLAQRLGLDEPVTNGWAVAAQR